jgi:UPF0271 protein
MSPRIDLNADVGEGSGSDQELIPLVSSVNVACGAHAGDAETMRRTVDLAARHGVAVGAHPGYPDREGFGRRDMGLSEAELRTSLGDQLRALEGIAASIGVPVGHVKPHGALYNRAASDAQLARTICEVVLKTLGPLIVVGLAGSELVRQGGAAGLPVAAEAFADRAYEADGSLRSRSLPGAVHADPATVARQAVAIARDGRIAIDGGDSLDVDADTLCLHGDSPDAVANALAVRAALAEAGIAVASLRSRVPG